MSSEETIISVYGLWNVLRYKVKFAEQVALQVIAIRVSYPIGNLFVE